MRTFALRSGLRYLRASTLCSTSAPTMKLLSAEVTGSTPEGNEHYAQAHLLFGFEHESYLMPAPEQRVVNCPCGAKVLLRWTWSIGSTPRATGNTSQRSTVRRPNCGSSGLTRRINNLQFVFSWGFQ